MREKVVVEEDDDVGSRRGILQGSIALLCQTVAPDQQADIGSLREATGIEARVAGQRDGARPEDLPVEGPHHLRNDGRAPPRGEHHLDSEPNVDRDPVEAGCGRTRDTLRRALRLCGMIGGRTAKDLAPRLRCRRFGRRMRRDAKRVGMPAPTSHRASQPSRHEHDLTTRRGRDIPAPRPSTKTSSSARGPGS